MQNHALQISAKFWKEEMTSQLGLFDGLVSLALAASGCRVFLLEPLQVAFPIVILDSVGKI